MKNFKVLILAFGVFSIINAEMGVVGILPLIAENYQVSIATSGLMVSMFALAVAISGPTMPLAFFRMNRKKAMIMVLGIFTLCNLISALATSFTLVLITRIVSAFFQPVYVSITFSVAAASVREEDGPKAVSKVKMGVSAGMVLGVPVVSYIANLTSLTIVMLLFAVVNAIALLLTVIFFPSMPMKEKVSYGEQLSILKESKIWFSIIGVMLLNGSIFGVYSYLSEYLSKVTGYSLGVISIILFVYGIANMGGNFIAGKRLSDNPLKFIKVFPFLLALTYVMQLIFGGFMLSTALLIFIWGILAGCAGNINQYLLTSAAPNAPDFANGLFLASANLGTSLGTTLCGGLIAGLGTSSIFIGGIVLLIGSIIFILMRIRGDRSVLVKQTVEEI